MSKVERKVIIHGSIEQHENINKAFEQYLKQDLVNDKQYSLTFITPNGINISYLDYGNLVENGLSASRHYLRNNTTMDEANMSDEQVKRYFLFEKNKIVANDDFLNNELTENWIDDLVSIQNTQKDAKTS